MYTLESSVAEWARRLLADNPSARAAAPAPARPAAYRPAADTEADTAAKRLVVFNLRSAAEHRRQDVLVASALLSAQLRSDLRSEFDQSNARFARNVASICGGARDAALGYQCELIAFENRLEALEQCTESSIAPLLQAEAVESVTGLLPKT